MRVLMLVRAPLPAGASTIEDILAVGHALADGYVLAGWSPELLSPSFFERFWTESNWGNATYGIQKTKGLSNSERYPYRGGIPC